MQNKKTIRKVILHQSQSPGDILTFTRAVADLKETYPHWLIDVRTPCPEIFENNPRITSLQDDEGEHFDITYDEINECGWRQEHWTDAYRHDVEKKLGVPVKKTGILPEIWISDLEKTWIHQVETEFNWKGGFWILNAGYKQDNELKYYPYWQEVVDILNASDDFKAKIVQIGHKDHIHPPLKNVYNLVGKTDLRQLIRLAYWARGSIGCLSFQSVLSASLKQPGVVVMGGKEDVRWHLYPHMKYLYMNGSLPCCEWGGCWLGGEKGKCKNLVDGVPLCFKLTTPQMIADAVLSYYRGGKIK